jgi:hypothetical protein
VDEGRGFKGKHKLIGATVNGAKGPFRCPFWSFNGIFYLIISSKLVQKYSMLSTMACSIQNIINFNKKILIQRI